MTSTFGLRWLWLLFGSLLAICAQAAPDQVVFGAKQYVRSSGEPNVYTDSFVLPSQVVAPYLLRIDNGKSDGTSRVTSATVTLNGVQVVGPNDFGEKVAVIERTVSVVPNNTLEVRVTGKPAGSFIKITIFGSEPLPMPVSITPNPLGIYAGSSGSANVELAPTPKVAGSLALVSDSPAIAAVPSSVNFAANQSNIAVPVTGGSPGSTAITATLNGGSATGTIQVTEAPPTISSLQPGALTLTQGGSANLTVTLSAAQNSAVQIGLTSADPTIAGIPSSVIVPPGQSSAEFSVAAYAPGTTTVTALLHGSSTSSQIIVTPAPPTVISLLPATSTVTLGANTTLDLTISAAQPNGTLINLSASPSGVVAAPSNIIIPAGQVSVPVVVPTLALGTVGVTANLNGSSTATAIHVAPPSLTVVSLSPSPIALVPNAAGTLTVTLNAAQPDNTEITLSTDNSGILHLPSTVTIPAGQTTATFTVTGITVGDASVLATANGTSQGTIVHVISDSAVPMSLLQNPLGLQQGAVGHLTLSINAAQLNDVVVPLTNTSPDIVQVPAQAIIPTGALSVDIPVTGLAAGFGTVTAVLNGVSATSNIEVTPSPSAVSGLTPEQLSLPKGVPGTLRILVNRTPAVPVLVPLTSSNPSVAEVPVTVTIPAGMQSAEFPVFARGEGPANITASLNGGSVSTGIIVRAPELVALTISPQTHTAYVGETVAFTVQGTYTDGLQQDLTSQATWTSSNTNVASMGGGAATALIVGSSTITATIGNVSTHTQLNVQQPPALTFSPNAGSVKFGNTLVLSVTSATPAGANGLVVTLTVSGAGSANVPASVLIPAGESTATFNLTGVTVGDITLTATAPQHLTATATYSVVSQLTIDSLNPSSGPVGSPVTIRGVNFAADAAGNEVSFNGERAIVASATTTELKVIVPVKATTGTVTVTTAAGTASSPTPFTVQAQQDFDIVLTPESIQAPLGGIGATRVKLVSSGLTPYAHAAQVSVSGLPAGVTAQLERASVYLNGETSLVINVPSGAPSGTYNLNVTATGPTETTPAIRSKTLALEILASGATTVSGRVMHAEDDAPFVGARIRLGDQAVFTDASGYYRFVSPTVLGDQVIKIDGHTAAGNGLEYPSAIAMPVMIEAGKDNVVLNSYIQAVDSSKYTTIVPGQKATVTVDELPGYSLNIPQGATLYGWDGTPVTKVNVRTVSVDRLPIRPLPAGVDAKIVYLYYFFREGGANPTEPIPVNMINDQGLLPGEKANMWYYDESTTPDPNSNQWRLMGQGTVSDDGNSIVSDPGVGIPKFCCGATAASPVPGNEPAGGNGGDGDGPQSCHPVDLASGNNLAFQMRGFGIRGLAPINISCSYRSTNARIGAFGRGVTFTYDWFVQAAGSAVRVTTPDGIQYLLSQGTDGIYRANQGRAGALGWEVRSTSSGRTLKFTDGAEMDFNGTGLLIEARDSNKNRTVFQRSSNGAITNITDAGGHVYRFDTTSVTIGRTIYTLVTKITDVLGRFIGFSYDNQLRMVSQTDVAGQPTTYTYDAASRIASKTEPNGGTKQFFYDAVGRTIKETLADGSEIRYDYAAVGSTVTETKMTDAVGNVTSHRFNGQGYLTRKVDALGQVKTTKLESARNLVLAETDTAGNITEYGYDAHGNRTHVKDAMGNLTLSEYDLANNKPIKVTNPLGYSVQMQYDVKGNLIKLTNPEGQSNIFTYSAQGQLVSVTDALGHTSHMDYDDQGNLTQVIDPMGRIIKRNRYDSANRLAEVVNAFGDSTQLNYDAFDRLIKITNAGNGVTQYAWDNSDNLIQVTDPNGSAVERNSYNLRKQITQRTDAANHNDRWEYDANGNVTLKTDRNGNSTRYTYDALNRIKEITDAGGRTTHYEYDLAGNVAAIRDSQSGDLLYNYDALNHLTKVISDQGTIAYRYDAIGRRTQRTVNGTDAVDYQYDKANKLTQISFHGKTTTYRYDVAGRPTEITLPNGIKQTYSYDEVGNVIQMQYLRPQ